MMMIDREMSDLESEITVMWMLLHSGVRGNERAD